MEQKIIGKSVKRKFKEYYYQVTRFKYSKFGYFIYSEYYGQAPIETNEDEYFDTESEAEINAEEAISCHYE